MEKEVRMLHSFSKGNFHQRACPTLDRTNLELPPITPHILSSLPYSTIILIMFRQLNMPALTTAQTWGNWLICTIINVGFEPIESLLTFKWYKDVISKVCAYPGWLSAWLCREWSNTHASAYPALLSATLTTLLTALCNWEENWGGGSWEGALRRNGMWRIISFQGRKVVGEAQARTLRRERKETNVFYIPVQCLNLRNVF